MTKINICLAPLTERQKQVYKMYKRGRSMIEVAKNLKLSPSTVSRTIKICIEKLYKFHYNLGKYRELTKSAKLTPREKDVFRRWKIYGHNARKIGKALGLSARTINKYQSRIRGKVDVNRLEHATRANDTLNGSDSFESFDYELNSV